MDDVILDDDDLLKDRLLRSLHRADDGHLATTARQHETAISQEHNAAVLYIYTSAASVYTLHEHYVYSHEPYKYKQWRDIVFAEIDRILKQKPKDWHGVYGWLTSKIVITPLRNGDLFIKIDNSGAHGVRLSFSSGKSKRETRKEKTKQKARN